MTAPSVSSGGNTICAQYEAQYKAQRTSAECHQQVNETAHHTAQGKEGGGEYLGGFAAASVSTDDHHVMLCELGEEVIADGEDRQAGPVLLPPRPLTAAPPLLQSMGHAPGLCLLLLTLLPHLWNCFDLQLPAGLLQVLFRGYEPAVEMRA